MPTYTLTTLATFTGSNGNGPLDQLVADSAGNLYGVTNTGPGQFGDGTVFEIVKSTGALQTLVSFTGSNGQYPYGGLITDSVGDLYGTTAMGGASDEGTAFEIVKSTGALQTLASFNGSNGEYPYAALIADSAGNLYGTTESGGTSSRGTVFEIVKSTGTVQTLASFNGSNGSQPAGGLIADSAGNLYGTTNLGGASGGGTVFEIVKSTGALQTLVNFNNANGSHPEYQNLIADSSGDLYGTTFGGGASGDGTVFEIVQNTGALQTLASFTGANGAFPEASLIADSAGDLFGTTDNGGGSGNGTVFEIVKSTGALVTLYSFAGGDGADPQGGLIADGAGNLYGTTYSGGAAGAGTVFELSPSASLTITDPSGIQTTSGRTPVQPFSTVSVSDPGAQSETATVTLSTAANGVLSGGGFTATNTPGVYTVTATSDAQAQADLRAATFTPAQAPSGAGAVQTTFTITVDDGTASASDSNTVLVAIPITDVSTDDRTPVAPFANVTVPDTGGLTTTLTLSFAAANGTLSGGGFTGGAGSYSFTGTSATIQAALRALVFTPTIHEVAPGQTVNTLITASDSGSSGTYGGVAVNLHVLSLNTSPTISGTVAGQAESAGLAISPFSQVIVTDPDASQGETVTVSFTAGAGTLAGGGFVQTALGVYAVTTPAGAAGASAAAAQADLRAAVFTPTVGQSATTTLTVAVSDGIATASDSITSVAATSMPPASAPAIGGTVAGQAVTDKATVAPFANATVTDANAALAETVTVTYAGANGALSGSGFTGAAGSYSASFASAAAAQAALQALVFTPTANQVTPEQTVTTGFTVAVNDGTATATDATTSVVANSVNDPPTLTGIAVNQAAAAGTATTPFASAVVTDPDTGQTETVTVSFATGAGAFAGAGFTGLNGVYTGAFASAAAAQAALRAATFTPTAGMAASDTLSVSVQDAPVKVQVPTTAATTLTVTSIASVNTPPAIGGAVANQADTAGVGISPFAAATVTDADAGQTETVTVTYTAANGVLSGGGFTGSNGSYTVAAASAAAAQADLRALVFTPTAGGSATTTFAVSVSDGQTTASDSTTSVVATYTAPVVVTGGGTPTTTAPPSAVLLTEFQNLTRALASGADAQNAASPQFQAEKALAAQLDGGQITLAQAETSLAHLVDGTTSVAVASYAFFTGYTPTSAGLNYLVHSSANATDLNDAYYQRFSTENRYINFAVNLATGPGAGAASFLASYGSLSLNDATAKAYQTVFGVAADGAKVSALLNTLVPDGLGGQETRATYFAQYGGDGLNGQGTKAAMIGFLLAQAVETGAGVYGTADLHYLAAIAHGIAPTFGSELALTYGPNVSLVGTTVTPDPNVTT